MLLLVDFLKIVYCFLCYLYTDKVGWFQKSLVIKQYSPEKEINILIADESLKNDILFIWANFESSMRSHSLPISLFGVSFQSGHNGSIFGLSSHTRKGLVWAFKKYLLSEPVILHPYLQIRSFFTVLLCYYFFFFFFQYN